jgi:integrase
MYEGIPYFTIQNNWGIKTEEEITEYRMFLYMVLLTAHRYGEILKLKKENVIFSENKIISPKTITKTKEDYHFPIPLECRAYIESIESGLLFPTINKSAIWHVYQRYIRDCEINIYEGKKLSIHDTRRLMLSVMIMDCGIDSRLADSCLNHKQKGVIKHYLHFQYKDIVGAYEQYWKKIKGVEEDTEKDKIVIEELSEDLQQTIKNLIKMENMKKQGLL